MSDEITAYLARANAAVRAHQSLLHTLREARDTYLADTAETATLDTKVSTGLWDLIKQVEVQLADDRRTAAFD